MTEFYSDETLYISVQDVDLLVSDPKTRVTAHIVQMGNRKAQKKIRLERQESGICTGNTPLDFCHAGEALVVIQAMNTSDLILSRHSTIRITNPVSIKAP